MSYDIYTGILKMMDQFQDNNIEIDFQYGYDETIADRLRIKYSIDSIAGTGNTLSKATNLLTWLNEHTKHVGNYDGQIANNALELLAYSYDKGMEGGINCCALSILLTECCLALGLFARVVYLMPLSPYDDDNHVVCEIYIPESTKWVMLDPTYNGYFMDERNYIYSVLELRQALANRAVIKLSDQFNYNGDYQLDHKEIETYFAKNLFYFRCRELQTFNSEHLESNRIIVFAPLLYDVKKSVLSNIDYRMEKWGHQERLQNWRDIVDQYQLIYCSELLLAKSPF